MFTVLYTIQHILPYYVILCCFLLQATFLAHLVGSDAAVASAHSSIKSMTRNSPGTELAARCCFLLEDPPDSKKEPTSSERYVIYLKFYMESLHFGSSITSPVVD